ncbi:MAG: 16S rRNA (uracil(1498)-N(3))-methyltransferase [Halieaceae bacterium]|jgi:16S rRNA (uracil1498-N3)-methyltransferase|nr:16S rRNA (uracil(1498)-N(3))-methyltransferase [Halieaceae bacterium]
MRIPRIFTERSLQATTRIELDTAPSQHISRVLRMRVGEPLTLFNGRGGEYPASIVALGKKSVTVETTAYHHREVESSLSVHLGIGISRGERMDWIIQKTTELGVNSLAPLFTARTEVKLKNDRAAKKMKHWHQIAISASEQCGRNQIPTIHPPQQLADWLEATTADRKLVLHHRTTPVMQTPTRPTSVALLTGPEGGLSEAEISAAEQAGYQSLTLGPRVLRSETAPLAALAILQAQWGDMPPEV